MGVDSLSHAFVVSLPFPGGLPSWSLFGIVLGAVIPDIDILFKPLSDRYPPLFILSHGGFTHSIIGAPIVSLLCLFGIVVSSVTGCCTIIPGGTIPPGLFIAIFAGYTTHLILDTMAFPGIPLLYPYTLRKFTLGIFPGPSVILFAISIITFGLLAAGVTPATLSPAYLALFISVILVFTAIRCFVRAHTPGKIIPTFHPFRWLVISEDENAYFLERYEPGKGRSIIGTYKKFQGVTKDEVSVLHHLPEVQRLIFYSYIVTAEQADGGILLRDPLRKERVLFYPPYYSEIVVSRPQELSEEW